MLLEQLRELKHFGLIDKKTYDGYPLKVEYFLTGQGEKMLSAIKIMQEIGIDYMVGHGMTEILMKKEFVMDPCHTYEKVSNLHRSYYPISFH